MNPRNWIVLAAAALVAGTALAQAGTPSGQPMPGAGMKKEGKKDMMMDGDKAAMPEGKKSGGMMGQQSMPREGMPMPAPSGGSGGSGQSGKPMPKM